MNRRVVVFFCNWSNYPGLKLSDPQVEEADAYKKYMVSMCSGRISPELILEAFSNGAWGVFITACPVDKCEHNANYKTCGRIALLKNMLMQMGVNPNRLRLEWVDKGEVNKFEKAVSTFMDDIKELGPVTFQSA
jgi:coenzyme F420-reducing hydrogenase delta subunit